MICMKDSKNMDSDFVRDILDVWNRLMENAADRESYHNGDDAKSPSICTEITNVKVTNVKHASLSDRKSGNSEALGIDTDKIRSCRCYYGDILEMKNISTTTPPSCVTTSTNRKDGGWGQALTMSVNNANQSPCSLKYSLCALNPKDNAYLPSVNHHHPITCDNMAHHSDVTNASLMPHAHTVASFPGMELTPGDNSDDKKRPLSVSSVTSSVSSSSLPRHQRKKLATCVMMSSAHAAQLNNISIEEDYNSQGELNTNGAHHCDQNAIKTKNSKLDTDFGELNDKDSGSDSSSLPRDVSSNISENSSSDISDLSCGVSNHSDNHTDNHLLSSHTVSSKQSMQSNNDSTTTPDNTCRRLGTVSKPNFTCDATPHTRAARNTLPPGGGGAVSGAQEALLEAARAAWPSHTYKVLQEILVTERVYVHDLQDIVQGYVAHLADCERIHDRLSKTELQRLFGNIMHLYVFNRELLESLEQCGSDPVRLAQCFVDHSHGFNIYTEYCTNYPSSVEVLTRVMCDSELAEIFKTQQLALQHGLPLGSYLLKPVQRILKYHLLLQNLLNNFDVRQAGYETVATALQCMTNVAQHTNEMKARHERAVHIQEIQSLLFGWAGNDLTTYGDLLLEDTFRMHGAKADRNLYLFEKVLIIAKKKEDGNLLVKTSIQCANLMVIESVPREPLSFHVIPFDNPRLQYTMQCRGLEQKHEWCQHLKRLILDNFSAVIPDKAKQLVMKCMGKSKEEQEFAESQKEDLSAGKSTKPHTAPEYLDRRRQRRKSSTLLDLGLLKGQRVFRMRRQSSVDGRSPDDGTGESGPADSSPKPSRLLLKSSSAENMLDLNESPQEKDEEQVKLKRAESLESIHSTSDTVPSSKPRPASPSKPRPLCSAAKSEHRVASRDLLDVIDTSLKLHDSSDGEMALNDALNCGSKRVDVDTPTTILPSNCISPKTRRDNLRGQRLSFDMNKKVPQRDSLNFDDEGESDHEEGSHNHSFLRSLSSHSDSILKAVTDQTGIVLKEPEEPACPRKYSAHDFANLSNLKETKIDNAHKTDSNHSQNKLQHLKSDSDSKLLSSNSKDRKPPSGSPRPGGVKSKLHSVEKSVHDRILYDSNMTSSPSLDLLTSPQQNRLSGDSTHSTPVKSMTKSFSSPSASHHSILSDSSHAVRLSSDLNRDGSRTQLNEIEKGDGETDPWTLRKQNSYRCRRNGGHKCQTSQRRSKSNVGDMSVLKNLVAAKNKEQNLIRSSSCSSLSDKEEAEPSLSSPKSDRAADANKSSSKTDNGMQQSPDINRSNAQKKLSGSSSFRDKFRNIVIPQRNSSKTPPRDAMNVIHAAISSHRAGAMEMCDLEPAEVETVLDGEVNGSVLSDNSFDMSSPRDPGSKASTLVSRDSTLDWSAIDEMENDEEFKKYQRDTMNHIARHQRPRSYNENIMHGIIQAPNAATGAASNESIMNSLKNAMASLTSRITRMGNSSSTSRTASPAQGFIRSRSLGAEHDARIKPVTLSDSPSPHLNLRTSPTRTLHATKHGQDRRKEKRNKLVYSLQRAYSERVKKRGRNHSKSPGGNHRNSRLYLHDPSLYESKTSINTAERLADSSPQGMGALTLRKPKDKTRGKKKRSKESNVESGSDKDANQACDVTYTGDKSSFVENKDKSKDLSELHTTSEHIQSSNPPTPTSVISAFKLLHGSNPSLREGVFLPSDIIDLVSKNQRSPFEDCVSLQSYYEQTLEANLDSDSMRDCTMCSDENEPETFDSESLIYPQENHMSTIFDTVRAYESCHQFSENTTSKENGHLKQDSREIQNIVHNLEMANKVTQVHTHEAQRVLLHDRERELKQCAMLSRIRQNSFEGVTEPEVNVETSINKTNELVCNCSESLDEIHSVTQARDQPRDKAGFPCPIHSSPRKGWVKQVISQIQTSSY